MVDGIIEVEGVEKRNRDMVDNPTNPEVMERLRGRPVPATCPHCGKLLDIYIGQRTALLDWNPEKGYLEHQPHYSDEPDYYCPACNNSLPESLISAIMEKLEGG